MNLEDQNKATKLLYKIYERNYLFYDDIGPTDTIKDSLIEKSAKEVEDFLSLNITERNLRTYFRTIIEDNIEYDDNTRFNLILLCRNQPIVNSDSLIYMVKVVKNDHYINLYDIIDIYIKDKNINIKGYTDIFVKLENIFSIETLSDYFENHYNKL